MKLLPTEASEKKQDTDRSKGNAHQSQHNWLHDRAFVSFVSFVVSSYFAVLKPGAGYCGNFSRVRLAR